MIPLLVIIALLFATLITYIAVINRRLERLRERLRSMEKAVLSLSKYNLAQAKLIQGAADIMEKRNAEKQNTEAE